MNKKLHFLLFCLLLIVILCSCKDKLLEIFVLEPFGNQLEPFGNQLEPFGNQIVIHPDTTELNPRETTFSILTYDTDLGSGVTQASTCSDDSSWSNDDKTCRDYSMEGANCEDIGSDGRLAFDACKVACDNCNTYTEVKRRLPSPVEEVDEPSYAQFEGSMSSGDIGSDIGGPDYREIIGKLDDLSGKIDLIEVSSGDTVDATCFAKNNTSNADNEACAAVTDLSTSDACEAVMTAAEGGTTAEGGTAAEGGTTAEGGTAACTYTNVSLDTVIKCNEIKCDTGTELIDNAESMTIENTDEPQRFCCKSTASEGNMQTCDNVGCIGDTPERRTFSQGSPTFSDLTDDQKQYICCTTPTGPTPPASTPGDPAATDSSSTCIQPSGDAITGYSSLNANANLSTTKFNIPNLACDTKSGYGTLEDGDGKQIPAKATACSEGGTAYTLEGCYKTSFCRENEKDIYDVHCMPFFFTDKEFEKGDDGKENIPRGQDFDTCCENNYEWRVWGIFFIILYFLYKTVSEWDDNDRETHTLWRVGGIFILAAWIFTNIIPYTIYYLRKFLDVEKEKSDIGSWWKTAFYFFIVVLPSAVFFYKYNNKY